MAHVQNFEVSSTKYVSSSNFIHNAIQMTGPKLLIGTLLSNTTLTWFEPLLECQSPLLNDFEAFLEEFGVFW
jgi:hypothetical protein